MKLVVIFVNKIEVLEDLLTGFLEIGVSGATVLDSVGMGRIISFNIPIFAGLREAFPGSSPSNKTIMTLVEDEMLEPITEVLEDICGEFGEPGSASMIVIAVEQFFGFRS